LKRSIDALDGDTFASPEPENLVNGKGNASSRASISPVFLGAACPACDTTAQNVKTYNFLVNP
jgi:hypothetical protein